MLDKVVSPSWKLVQMGIVVRDMDQAVRRFSALGFGPFAPILMPPGTKAWFRGEPNNARVDLQGTTIGNVELELLHPVSGQSPHKEFLDSKGEGIHHVMFAVDDLEYEVERLTKLGATVLFQASFGNDESGGVVYLDLDASGFIVELIKKQLWELIQKQKRE
jgi:methylmalonyl-CoA/ethylmalonyl-CoA epimerase